MDPWMGAPFRIKRSVTPRSPFMAEYKSAVNPYCIREVGTDKPHKRHTDNMRRDKNGSFRH